MSIIPIYDSGHCRKSKTKPILYRRVFFEARRVMKGRNTPARWDLSQSPTPANPTSLSCYDHQLSTTIRKSCKKKTHGSNPMPFTFHTPNARAKKLHATNAALTPNIDVRFPSVSSRANVDCTLTSAVTGVLNSINTIMMLKICSELPVMYMPNAFMGICFAGASAISHAFFSLSVSTSCVVGGVRAEVLLPPAVVFAAGGSAAYCC